MTDTTIKTPPATVLILRACTKRPDGTLGPTNSSAKQAFVWPVSGPVECPDWDPAPVCGQGLHGFLWGEGSAGEHVNWTDEKDGKLTWLVVEVLASDVVDLTGKVKFPRGVVVSCGDRKTATDYLIARAPNGKVVIGAFVTAGDRGTATAGDRGTATAGDWGTATAGNSGTATAGYAGTATAGYRGTATAGDRGTATAGYYGTATAGYQGTATAGDWGTATAGYAGTATAGVSGTATAGGSGTAIAGGSGTATAGYRGTAHAGYQGTATAGYQGTATAGYQGTATAGYAGTATAGHYGTATAGEGGELRIRWYDGKRYRLAVGYVGEDGIEPNVNYRVENGKFAKAGSL